MLGIRTNQNLVNSEISVVMFQLYFMEYGDDAGQLCLTPISIPYCIIVFCISQARVNTTEDDERLQKKQRQEAIMAQFKAKYDLSNPQ